MVDEVSTGFRKFRKAFVRNHVGGLLQEVWQSNNVTEHAVTGRKSYEELERAVWNSKVVRPLPVE
jgi:hypothetical protein